MPYVSVSGAEGLPPWLKALSEKIFRIQIGKNCTSQPRSFDKTSFEKFGLDISAPIQIQLCENMSGYDTVMICSLKCNYPAVLNSFREARTLCFKCYVLVTGVKCN